VLEGRGLIFSQKPQELLNWIVFKQIRVRACNLHPKYKITVLDQRDYRDFANQAGQLYKKPNKVYIVE
jgi:hypothetical protein